MKMNDNMFLFCVAILLFLFIFIYVGEPDIHDAILKHLMGD